MTILAFSTVTILSAIMNRLSIKTKQRFSLGRQALPPIALLDSNLQLATSSIIEFLFLLVEDDKFRQILQRRQFDSTINKIFFI